MWTCSCPTGSTTICRWSHPDALMNIDVAGQVERGDGHYAGGLGDAHHHHFDTVMSQCGIPTAGATDRHGDAQSVEWRGRWRGWLRVGGGPECDERLGGQAGQQVVDALHGRRVVGVAANGELHVQIARASVMRKSERRASATSAGGCGVVGLAVERSSISMALGGEVVPSPPAGPSRCRRAL